MKNVRRLLLVIAAVTALVCVILLLNFTAANPTGRRYSSEVPLTTGEGSAGEIGGDGERILARDLHLPNNNASDQRQCICGDSGVVPGGCHVCLAHSAQVANYRIPDFVGPNFIAEAKNVRDLVVAHDRDFQQIREIAAAAGAAGIPFWVYVRADTMVDPAFYALFDGLKGGIVPYFAVPGYVDAVDYIAQIGLLLALVLIAGLLAWDLLAHRSPDVPDQPGPPAPKRTSPRDPLRKAEEAQDFARRMKDRARSRIDLDDDSGNGKHK